MTHQFGERGAVSYLTQAVLIEDGYLIKRITACAASEGIESPGGWVSSHAWRLSDEPGWVDAYRAAQAAGDKQPGANEAAITDAMILTAVQKLRPQPDPA